ncbi:MAG: hypothetical protein IJG50_08190 [Clostridia bacterium]|nr:hypothetical protein [Clostridia bacterium]
MPDKKDDLFGDMFDFNGDKKTDMSEKYIAYKIFQETIKDLDGEHDDEFDDEYDDEHDDEYDDKHDDATEYAEPDSYRAPPPAPSVPPPDESDDPDRIGSPPDGPITLEEYRKRQRESAKGAFYVFLITLVLSAIPILLIIGGISTLLDYHMNATGLGLVLLCVGVILLCIVFALAFMPLLGFVTEEVSTNRRLYEASLTEETKSRKIKKTRVAGVIFLVVFLAAVLFVCAYVLLDLHSAHEIYLNAEEYALEGRYEEALTLLESIEGKEQNRAGALAAYCRARLDYNNGLVYKAYEEFGWKDYNYESEELSKKAKMFKQMLEQRKDELDRKAEREAKKLYGDKEPYVGMSEAYINYTSLGRADDVDLQFDEVSSYEAGKTRYRMTSTYYFYRGYTLIVKVQCVDGRVKQIWDYREKETVNDKPGAASHSAYTDPGLPASEDFDHPSDFYEWYIDDFIDYEEAEDYYYDHGGR